MVKPRQLHCCPEYAFEGLARWLTVQLRQVLSKMPNLVVNSDAAAAKLAQVQIAGDEGLIKLDVKDFYLSGSQHDIVSTIRHALWDPFHTFSGGGDRVLGLLPIRARKGFRF